MDVGKDRTEHWSHRQKNEFGRNLDILGLEFFTLSERNSKLRKT